jgi:3-hydroxy-9,10-secoandrosta-1,3,5(10)-triene-9,17-dione monooxygenase
MAPPPAPLLVRRKTVQIKVAEAGARIDAAELVMRRNCEHAMTVARAGEEFTLADKLR